MQPIAGAEIDSSHADSPLAVISPVSAPDGVGPGVSQGARHGLAVSNLHQEVIVSVSRLELGHGGVVCSQRDQARARPRTIPAAKFPAPGRLVIHGCADKQDPLYLLESVKE
mgnify:CR=1 FL=1